MSINFNYNYPQVAREAGFRLRQYRDGPLDWRLLGTCEIDRILRDQNLEEIDKMLPHISEAPLGSILLESNILDHGIAKYFIISQFAIQYLLFCRNFLDETVQELRESHAEGQLEMARVKKSLTEANNEILQLHKKMTQMEAIHEVIYPCHLCTKNFANNEALNIHIGRKHAAQLNRTIMQPERHIETPAGSGQKERTNDLTLINTIKLELEIKQLKERLNAAEKDIRERVQQSSVGNSKRTTPREMAALTVAEIEMRHIGIQSNLSEEKERNECTEDDGNEESSVGGIGSGPPQSQLVKLQEKICDIEEWRTNQMANNEESIAEINKKLTDIAEVLERTATIKQFSLKDEQATEDVSNASKLERRVSVEDLERVLTEKVAEIGKASSEKLEEFVHNIETNYREKLLELELEVKKANAAKEVTEAKENRSRFKRSNVETKSATKLTNVKTIEPSEDSEEEQGTYNIDDKRHEAASTLKPTTDLGPLAASPTSNHTYVKEDRETTKFMPVEAPLSDNTDISESLSEDDMPEKPVIVPTDVSSTAVKSKPTRKLADLAEKPLQKSPRKYTRKDAKKLVTKRLSRYGLDMSAKSISNSSLKHVTSELNDKRMKLKQKYPNFYATRNKLKKFVDKLCTSKSAEKAEKLLTTTSTLQPIKAPRRLQAQRQILVASSDEDESDKASIEAAKPTTSTALNANGKRDDFKKRLERLLASPVQRPISMASVKETANTVAQVHADPVRPLPMPRKRVMFNTGSSVGNGIN